MESSPDPEELPYVVWYQCRMCTHLLFDDIEKMFMHFEKKHGAMIDCEELRGIVYKNGLCMGGLSRSPKPVVKSEDGNETETELVSPYPHSVDDDDDNVDKMLLQQEIENDEMVLPGVHDEEAYADENYQQNEDNDEDYDKSVYKAANHIDDRYSCNGRDKEEQLPKGEIDFTSNGFHYNQNEHLDNDSDDNTQVMESSILCQPSQIQDYNEYDDDDYEDGEFHETNDYKEEDNYQDEGEEGELSAASAGQSINQDDLDELIYADGVDYEDDDEMGNDEMYSGEANQTGGILNYGYSCKFCGKFFTTRRGVESHEQHHKSQTSPIIKRTNEGRIFPCKICKDKTFPSFKDLKQHVKTHTPERIHICKFCYSTFNNTASLTKHLTIHTRENPHKCHCGKTFVSANTLKIHKKIHTGIKPFVCNFFQCGRAFVTKSTLESHLRTHTGEKPYQCSFCTSSFTTSSAKYRHERHVHKVPEPSIM